MLTKLLTVVFSPVLLCVPLIEVALSHGGGLNNEGCHNQRSNGSYHCHQESNLRSVSRLIGVATVTDGDTFKIDGVKIRLFGIDAPEASQLCKNIDGEDYQCGQLATLALAGRIGRGLVACDNRGKDRYERLISVCVLDGADLNGWMVSLGHAVAYHRYANDYIYEEEAARLYRRGIWQGRFVVPEKWRRGAR
jgi:endonuclease YncB( thermonuclease family)